MLHKGRAAHRRYPRWYGKPRPRPSRLSSARPVGPRRPEPPPPITSTSTHGNASLLGRELGSYPADRRCHPRPHWEPPNTKGTGTSAGRGRAEPAVQWGRVRTDVPPAPSFPPVLNPLERSRSIMNTLLLNIVTFRSTCLSESHNQPAPCL